MIAIRPLELMDIVPLGELVLSSIDEASSSLRESNEYPRSPLLVGEEVTSYDETGIPPLVADLDGAIAGFASFERRAMARSSHVMELRVLVHPAARGRGIGEALLEGARERAFQDPGVTKVFVTVAEDDHGLLRLIARSGGWRREQRAPGGFARGARRVGLEIWASFDDRAPRCPSAP